MKPILIGTGHLNWQRAERVSDRYGIIHLNSKQSSEQTEKLAKVKSQEGFLSVKILEVCESQHIGDLFRGISPGGAIKGEVFDLGEGKLVYESYEGIQGVGVKPKDGRETIWMSPERLYRAHDQKVELYFTPKAKSPVKKKTATKKTTKKTK